MEGEREKGITAVNTKGHKNTGHGILSGKIPLREVQRPKRPRFTPVQQLFGTAIEKLSKLRLLGSAQTVRRFPCLLFR